MSLRRREAGGKKAEFAVYLLNTSKHPDSTMANSVVLASWQQRLHDNLLRFLRSRVRSADIADLAQETYLRLLRAPNLSEVRNPEAYLIRVANHVAAEWALVQRQTQSLDAEHLAVLTEECTAELQTDARICQRRFDAVLAALVPLVRATLVLRLRDGLSYKEIAHALNLTERQVKRYLANGLERLRAALADVK